jgi:NitT/TauT family transport system substrate-binding protein
MDRETTRVRLTQRPTLCEAPNYVAEALLRGEGFTDWRFLNELKKELKS